MSISFVKSAEAGSGSAASLTPDLGSTPTAGNLLILAGSTQTLAPVFSATGFTLIQDNSGNLADGCLLYKVSDGTEQSVTLNFGTGAACRAVYLEYTGNDSSPFDVSDEDTSNVDTGVTSCGSGSAVSTQADSIAIAAFTPRRGDYAYDGRSYSNDFSERIATQVSTSSRPGLSIAEKVLTATGSQSTTFTTTDTGTEMWSVIAVFKAAGATQLPIKLTLDRNRTNMAIAIHNFPLTTGPASNLVTHQAGDLTSYGAYFTGNYGIVNADVAHTQLLYYNSDGTTLDLGETSYTTTANNLGAGTGALSFWFDPTALSADEDLFNAATDFKVAWDDSESHIVFTYGTASITTSTAQVTAATHVKVTWTASGEITMEVNGTSEDAVEASTAPTPGATMSFGTDVTKIYITDNPQTPQVPCAGGVPITMPEVTKG